MRKFATIGLAVAACLAPAARAQEEPAFHSEVGVSAIGAFTSQVNGNGIRQGASDSGGVLASYRYLFTPHHGVEVNYGYSLNTQQYNLTGIGFGVHSNVHEVTASYVYRFPSRRIAPFVSAGTGALLFDPDQAFGATPAASTQARAAFVYSGGFDVRLSPRLSFRAQYRGLVYKAPDFGLASLNADSIAHRAEPVGGFFFRF